MLSTPLDQVVMLDDGIHSTCCMKQSFSVLYLSGQQNANDNPQVITDKVLYMMRVAYTLHVCVFVQFFSEADTPSGSLA